MKTLFETNELILEHEYELVHLKEKATGKVLLEDDFYGDPECGLIDKENRWAIVTGEHLTIWTPEDFRIIKNEDIKWVHSLRAKNSDLVEILVDPWSDISSIWEIDVSTFEVRKVRDFDDYKDKDYTENIIW
jgi:hypothetical protein